MKSANKSSLIRNFTFGVEDSLASTVGLLSGVASAQASNQMIILTGLVLIFTEALSMGVGSFLSEQSVSEYKNHKDVSLKSSVPGAVIMFVSYLIAGLLPLSPYVLFPMPYSLYLSIAASLVGLGFLGYLNARFSKVNPTKLIVRMLILGGLVAIAGVFIGDLLKGYGTGI